MSSPPHIEGYRLGRTLGRGGAGIVYEALDLRTGTVRAIKVMTARSGRHASLEAAMMRRVSHPHVVELIASGLSAVDKQFVVMELLHDSLSGLVARHGPLPESLAAIYVAQVLIGLAHLHSEGVLHGDVKGANALLSIAGVVKLADFGSAIDLTVVTSSDATGGSGRGGLSCYWASPEVISMQSPGAKSDIWSVGALVVEITTGNPPFATLPPLSALFRIVQEGVTPPPNTSPQLKDFLSACFQRDPSQRPSAAELLSSTWISQALTALAVDTSAETARLLREVRHRRQVSVSAMARAAVAQLGMEHDDTAAVSPFGEFSREGGGGGGADALEAAIDAALLSTGGREGSVSGFSSDEDGSVGGSGALAHSEETRSDDGGGSFLSEGDDMRPLPRALQQQWRNIGGSQGSEGGDSFHAPPPPTTVLLPPQRALTAVRYSGMLPRSAQMEQLPPSSDERALHDAVTAAAASTAALVRSGLIGGAAAPVISPSSSLLFPPPSYTTPLVSTAPGGASSSSGSASALTRPPLAAVVAPPQLGGGIALQLGIAVNARQRRTRTGSGGGSSGGGLALEGAHGAGGPFSPDAVTFARLPPGARAWSVVEDASAATGGGAAASAPVSLAPPPSPWGDHAPGSFILTPSSGIGGSGVASEPPEPPPSTTHLQQTRVHGRLAVTLLEQLTPSLVQANPASLRPIISQLLRLLRPQCCTSSSPPPTADIISPGILRDAATLRSELSQAIVSSVGALLTEGGDHALSKTWSMRLLVACCSNTAPGWVLAQQRRMQMRALDHVSVRRAARRAKRLAMQPPPDGECMTVGVPPTEQPSIADALAYSVATDAALLAEACASGLFPLIFSCAGSREPLPLRLQVAEAALLFSTGCPDKFLACGGIDILARLLQPTALPSTHAPAPPHLLLARDAPVHDELWILKECSSLPGTALELPSLDGSSPVRWPTSPAFSETGSEGSAGSSSSLSAGGNVLTTSASGGGCGQRACSSIATSSRGGGGEAIMLPKALSRALYEARLGVLTIASIQALQQQQTQMQRLLLPLVSQLAHTLRRAFHTVCVLSTSLLQQQQLIQRAATVPLSFVSAPAAGAFEAAAASSASLALTVSATTGEGESASSSSNGSVVSPTLPEQSGEAGGDVDPVAEWRTLETGAYKWEGGSTNSTDTRAGSAVMLSATQQLPAELPPLLIANINVIVAAAETIATLTSSSADVHHSSLSTIDVANALLRLLRPAPLALLKHASFATAAQAALGALRRLSSDVVAVEVLASAGAVGILVQFLLREPALLEGDGGDVAEHVLTTLVSILRVNRARCEAAAEVGIVDIVRHVLHSHTAPAVTAVVVLAEQRRESPLIPLAVQVLCDLGHAGPLAAAALHAGGGVAHFLSVVEGRHGEMWVAPALSALASWAGRDEGRVAIALSTPASVTVFTTVLKVCSDDAALPPLVSLITRCPSLARPFTQERRFCAALATRLAAAAATVSVGAADTVGASAVRQLALLALALFDGVRARGDGAILLAEALTSIMSAVHVAVEGRTSLAAVVARVADGVASAVSVRKASSTSTQ